MQIKILNECGYHEALYGLGLSYGKTSNLSFEKFKFDIVLVTQMSKILQKLAKLDGGHNKALESIQIWMSINAPRCFWQQFDTYRMGITKQSESTEHTLLRKKLTLKNFSYKIPEKLLYMLNEGIKLKDLAFVKAILPESFLQKRIISLNYKALRNILKQRSTHRMLEWREFCKVMPKLVKYPALLGV